tara:strand:- start:912 stop:2039 length:1128 start_codon:yes stop_codon:yes gene_type:complete
MALTLHGTVSDNTVVLSRPNATPIIYNGDMLLAQRGTSATSITGGGYPTVDRFYMSMLSAGTFTQTQSTDVPTGQGFTKSLKWDCTTANGSLGAGSYLLPLEQHFEGQDLQLLRKGTSSAKGITIAFWIKSNLTGNFNLEIWDRENDRQITKAVTINSANTWEKKVSSFPADTTGTLTADNSNRLQIALWAGGGTNFTSGGSLQTSWGAITHTKRAYNTVNLASSTDNELYITGVQLEIGEFDSNSIPDFQFEDVGTSLARCQRYFISHAVADGTRLGDGIFRSTTRIIGNVDCMGLVPNMRATPSVATTITSFQIYHGSDTTTNCAASSGSGLAMSGTQECRTDFTFSSGSTTGGLPGKLRASSAGAMQYEAEL